MKFRGHIFISLLFYTFFNVNFISAQAPTLEWSNFFGTADWAIGYSIDHTIDNGYIVVGYKTIPDPSGLGRFYLVKLFDNGTVDWERSISGFMNERAFSINHTADGGHIIGGMAQTNDPAINEEPEYDGRIVKLGMDGFIEWSKLYGNSSSDDEIIEVVKETSDGGFIVAGHVGKSFMSNNSRSGWVLKVDSFGSIVWEHTYDNGPGQDRFFDIIQTNDNGYLVVGDEAYSQGWIMKLSEDGTIDWEKNISTSYGFNSVLRSTDGGFIVAGTGYLVIKLNSSGDIQWEQDYGGSGFERARKILKSVNGGYLIGGYTSSEDGDVSNNYGSADSWIINISEEGELEWEISVGSSRRDETYDLIETSNGDIVVVGYSWEADDGNNRDLWVYKLDVATSSSQEILSEKKGLKLYPNPVKNFLEIKSGGQENKTATIKIVSISGKTMYKSKTPVSEIDVSQFPAGLYFLEYRTEDYVGASKFIKE